jgi:hypothetical protein
MSDVSYSVEVSFLTRGDLSKSLGNLGGTVGKLNSSLSGVGENFARSFGASIDKVGGTIVDTIGGAAKYGGATLAAGLGAALKEGLNFGAFVEGSTNGLAATLSMLGDIPIDKGLRQAERSVENLRKAAAVLPGEFKDALGAFQSILPAGLNNGVSMARLEKLGAQSVAVAASLGIQQSVAGHELAALLEGRARSSMPLASRLGIHAKEWNAQSADKRFSKIETMFGKMDPAMQLFQGSWAGMTSTIKDNARNVSKTFAAPLFDSIKLEMGKGLAWFGSHEDEVHAWAAKLGVGVDYAFHQGLDALRHWTPIAVTFGHTLYAGVSRAAARLESFAQRLGTMAERFMLDPHAIDKLERVAGELVALRVGAGVASGAGSLMSSMPALSAMGAPIAELASAAPFIAAGLAAAAVAAYGFTSALTDTSSQLHAVAVEEAKSGAASTARLGREAMTAADGLKPLAELAGVASARVYEHVTGTLADLAHIANVAGEALQQWTFLLSGAPLNKTPTGGPDYPYSPNGWEYGGSVKSLDFLGDDGAPKAPSVHNHHTTINNKIEVRVVSNQDPNRIAKKTVDLIRDASRNPKSVPSAARTLQR